MAKPSLPEPRSSSRLLILAILLVAVITLLAVRARKTPTADPATGHRAAAGLPPEVLRDFTRLEAAESEVDRRVWAPERLAEQHGRFVDDLWDRLNASADALGELAGLEIHSLAVPRLPEPEELPHGLRRWRTAPGRGHEGVEAKDWDWRSRLTAWRAEGWILERSEWRHLRFTPSSPARWATSLYEVHLHATRPQPARRAQVTARITVAWPHSPPDSTTAEPGEIRVEQLEILERDGPPVFRAVANLEIPPFPRTSWIDPVIARVRPATSGVEFILAARNLVIRRGIDGQWRSHELSPWHPGLIFTAILADFSGDGRDDLLMAVRSGLVLMRGDSTGGFSLPAGPAWPAPVRLEYAQAFTCGDVDGDGDLDVFLGQYRPPYQGGQMPRPYFDALDGPPSFFLLNRGDGQFDDATERAGLTAKRHRRSYGASLADLDGDADLDLLVTSDFAGVDVYENLGGASFRDRTMDWLDEPRAFGMSHASSDFDADGQLDFVLVGMPQPTADRLIALNLERPDFASWALERPRINFGNRLYFGSREGFRQRPESVQVARTGWCWSVAAADLDHDRFPDLHFVNGHETRRSVRDYEREFWTHDIYVGDSTPRAAVEAYFAAKLARSRSQGWSYGGYDKNRLYLNRGGREFVEAGHLFGLALEEDSRNVLAEDLDGDGDLDLLVTTFEVWPQERQTVRVFENTLASPGHWIAIQLASRPGDPSPVGAAATLRDEAGVQTRHYVIGEGYRSQASGRLHFGLGAVSHVREIEVRWVGGERTTLRDLAVDRIHSVNRPGP